MMHWNWLNIGLWDPQTPYAYSYAGVCLIKIHLPGRGQLTPSGKGILQKLLWEGRFSKLAPFLFS